MLGALCAAALLVAPASAAVPTFETSFDGSTISPPPSRTFTVAQVAADASTGDVYVLDEANQVIDRFSAAGVYLSQITPADTVARSFNLAGIDGLAVDNSGGPNQGNVYLVAEGTPTVMYAFDPEGALLWETTDGLSDSCGVAVDSRGRVFSSDYSNGVQEHDIATGNAIGSRYVPGANNCAAAFAANDDLYLNTYGAGIDKFASPTYDVRVAVDNALTSGIATDTSTNDLFGVSNGIRMYDAAGALDRDSPFGDAGTLAVAVDANHGKLYATTSRNETQVFRTAGAATPKPSVRTGVTSNIGDNSLDIAGRVNPNGSSTTCAVEIVSDTQFGIDGYASASRQPCSAPVGSGTSETVVSASLTGLNGGTDFHYRVVATNANGTVNGSSGTVRTTGNPQHALRVVIAGTGSGSVRSNPTGINDCTATCAASFDEGTRVTLTATPSNSRITWSDGGCSGSGTCEVTLNADTTVTATFAQDPPTVDTEPATDVTDVSATLNATVNPNGAATTCEFEYGTTTSYGTTVPCEANPGSGTSPVAVRAAISGLTPSTEYHYRINARNTGGPATPSGDDVTFTTDAPPLPIVVTGAASNLTQTTATLAGTVNPNGYATTCYFEYGATTSYGTRAPCSSAPGAGSGAVAAGASLTGLTAATTYHFRLVATNAGGTANGDDATFTTAADTCATNAALCPRPLPETCETNPALCPQPQPDDAALGLAASTASVARGKASVKLACKGTKGTCSGTVKLVARIKQGRRTKRVVVGQAKVNLTVGKSVIVKVKLNRTGKKALARKHKLAVTLSGAGLDGKKLTLKEPARRKKKK